MKNEELVLSEKFLKIVQLRANREVGVSLSLPAVTAVVKAVLWALSEVDKRR